MISIARAVSDDDLQRCLDIRRVVFIEEQNVSEAEELDGKDPLCLHYLMTDGDTAIATARVLPLGETAKIQRVGVLREARLGGTGTTLMRFVLDDLASNQTFRDAILGSQTHAIGFYEKLGFVAEGPEYDDAGIPHRDMRRTL